MDATAFAACLLLLSSTAAAQGGSTQQARDAQGTKIELHQTYRSDSSGTASGVATRIQRSDGTGALIGREQSNAAPALSPAPAASSPAIGPSTTTTTTRTTVEERR